MLTTNIPAGQGVGGTDGCVGDWTGTVFYHKHLLECCCTVQDAKLSV